VGLAVPGAAPGVDPGSELIAVGKLEGAAAPPLDRLGTAAVGILGQLRQL